MSSFFKKLIFLLLLILIFTSGVLIIRAINNAGNQPRVHLQMDEGSGDVLYNAAYEYFDAAVSGGATWQNEPHCKFGKCIYLDGDGDYVRMGDFPLN